jgi:hypothetical protein
VIDSSKSGRAAKEAPVARTSRKTRRGSDLARFIDKVLTGGVDIDKLLADPVALASMSGVRLTKPQKAQLSKLPLAATLEQFYTDLGGVDKRFLMAKRKDAFTSIPPTLIIPIVGVAVAVVVVATVLSAAPAKVVDNSPRAKDKL